MNQLGLTHLSLRVADLDAVALAIESFGGAVVRGTRTTFGDDGALDFVYCTDPDGVRIELMRLPGMRVRLRSRAWPSPSDTGSARSIENLIARYAELIDAGDLDRPGGAVRRRPLRRRGRRRGAGGGSRSRGCFAAWCACTRTARRAPSTSRPTSASTWTTAAGTAVAHSYVTVFQALPDLPLQPIVAGRYRDVFSCTDGAWHFVERRFTTDLVGDVSKHLSGRARRLGVLTSWRTCTSETPLAAPSAAAPWALLI